MKNPKALIYTNYIGRYTTRIFIEGQGDIYSCDDTELDLEGKKLLLSLKFKGYEIIEE